MCFTRQAKRLRATDREIDNLTINDKLLSQLDHKTEYKMKIAMDVEEDLSEFITQLENIVNVKKNITKIHKKDNYKDNKTENNEGDKKQEPTCYKCGNKGHKSNTCPSIDNHQGKKIYLLHHEDNQEPISAAEYSSIESLPDIDNSSK